MINWAYFPKSIEADDISKKVVNSFKSVESQITSDNYTYESNDVLKIVASHLISLGFIVEKSKKSGDKIHVPVLFGINGKTQLSFDADAYNKDLGYVIEVEAGRAVTNYQFLKDFFEASMMYNVDYLCIAVRNIYRKSKDFEQVVKFFDAMFSSKRIVVPLKGLLVIGY